MGLKTKILGHSYNIKTIRRQVRNGQQDKVVEDRAALIEDEVTGEKKLKLQNDGKEIPKPSNLSFDQLQTSGGLLGGGGATDFIEIEEDGDETSIINFHADKKSGELKPEKSEKEHIFQAHRNFLNKKTIEAWSSEDNTKLLITGYLTLLSVITVAAIWFIVNGSGEAIAQGVAKGLEGSDVAAGAATSTAFIAKMKINELRG